MKKLLVLMICTLLAGCSQKERELQTQTTISSGFDTFITLNVYATEEEMDEYFEVVQEQFTLYNAYFDKYHNYENINNIKTINDNAGIAPVKVNDEIIDMLLMSKKYSELSNNQFDITIGPILKLWHDVRELATAGQPYTLPTSQMLENAKACSGWDKVEIDEKNKTVYLNQACASLDVGSVAKGYATEQVAQQLMKMGAKSGFLSAGGNIKLLGSKPDGNSWNAGIITPELSNNNETMAVVPLFNEQSLVTSGDYQRYFIDNGLIMHHIIDPHTLSPSRHAKSVSIVTENSGLADICSTMLFTSTLEEGQQFIEKIRQQGIDIEAVWIYDTDEELQNVNPTQHGKYYVIATDGIQEVLKLK